MAICVVVLFLMPRRRTSFARKELKDSDLPLMQCLTIHSPDSDAIDRWNC